jgi:hypothetical protein
MVQQPVPSGAQGMMVAPVGRPGAGGPQQPGSGPMNPNQPGQSTYHLHFIGLHTFCKVTHFINVLFLKSASAYIGNPS